MSGSEAIPGASRLRNQNEILIEKSDEAIKNKIKKSPIVTLIKFLMSKLLRRDQVVYLVLCPLLNDANEFFRTRLCAPTLE